MLARLLQFWNAYGPIVVTLSGSSTAVSPVHPENAYAHTFFSPSGSVTDVSAVQFWNA